MTAAASIVSFTTTARPIPPDNVSDSVIWEYDLGVGGVPSQARPREIIRVPQFASNHNGGHIAFGPDGHLYATFGDGGAAVVIPRRHGQRTPPPCSARSCGSLPTAPARYTVPADNPFVGDASSGPTRSSCTASATRGSSRFDAFTDDLWVADVGQKCPRGDQPAGGDARRWATVRTSAGTPSRVRLRSTTTATPTFPLHVGPIYEYQTGGPEGRSITGGFVYRGSEIVGLDGTYLWADFVNPELRGWNETWGGPISYDVNVPGGSVSSFVQDLDGEIYAISFTGSISQVVVAG